MVIERMPERSKELSSDEQGGFRCGKGCMDQVLSVRQLVKRACEKDRKLFMVYVDLERACNRVNLQSCQEILRSFVSWDNL